jgi:hypothetical protein
MKFAKNRFFVFIFIIFVIACVPKIPENTARVHLEPVLQEGLTGLIDGIDSSAILELPYFEISEFKRFGEGEYQYIAIVDFFFLKNIPKKVVRKYRFHHRRKWELYYNEYQSF